MFNYFFKRFFHMATRCFLSKKKLVQLVIHCFGENNLILHMNFLRSYIFRINICRMCVSIYIFAFSNANGIKPKIRIFFKKTQNLQCTKISLKIFKIHSLYREKHKNQNFSSKLKISEIFQKLIWKTPKIYCFIEKIWNFPIPHSSSYKLSKIP